MQTKVTFCSRHSTCAAGTQTNRRAEMQMYQSVPCVSKSVRCTNGARGLNAESSYSYTGGADVCQTFQHLGSSVRGYNGIRNL